MGADVIALWHGVPGKKINTALLEQKKNLKKLPFFLYTYIFPYKYYAYCNYVYCPNENLLDIYKECFQIGKPQILIHKQPRNLYAKKIDKQERLILYAPTYRKDQKLINVMKSLDFFEEQTKEFICSSGIKIVVRPHPIDVQELEKEELPEYLVIDKSKDIYETINKYELVITDFSSLFYDAQEQEIDVRILQNDLDLYNDSNGLFTQFYDYIKANSKCSLVEILKDIIEG